MLPAGLKRTALPRIRIAVTVAVFAAFALLVVASLFLISYATVPEDKVLGPSIMQDTMPQPPPPLPESEHRGPAQQVIPLPGSRVRP